jgi:hypothetical protein
MAITYPLSSRRAMLSEKPQTLKSRSALPAGGDRLQVAGREIASGDRHVGASRPHRGPKRRASRQPRLHKTPLRSYLQQRSEDGIPTLEMLS